MYKTCSYVQNMFICTKHVHMYETCSYVQNMSDIIMYDVIYIIV